MRLFRSRFGCIVEAMRNVRRSLLVAVLMLGCGKEAPQKAPEKPSEPAASAETTTAADKAATPEPPAAPAEKPPAPLSDPKALAEEFGVPPGGLEHAKNE